MAMRRLYLVLIIMGAMALSANCQSDSTSSERVSRLPHKMAADTSAEHQNDTLDLTQRKNPKKAALLSALIPGAGQIYNRKYWKLPIVYGAIGATSFLFFNNRYWYQEYRTAYINDLEEGNPPSVYQLEGVSTSQLREAADASRKNMEYAVIGFIAVYALQIVDATVDAHLFHFDVSDDLTLNWQPDVYVHQNATPMQGITLNLTF